MQSFERPLSQKWPALHEWRLVAACCRIGLYRPPLLTLTCLSRASAFGRAIIVITPSGLSAYRSPK